MLNFLMSVINYLWRPKQSIQDLFSAPMYRLWPRWISGGLPDRPTAWLAAAEASAVVGQGRRSRNASLLLYMLRLLGFYTSITFKVNRIFKQSVLF